MTHQNSLIQTLQELETEALSAIRAAPEGGTLEALRISYLGRKGGPNFWDPPRSRRSRRG